MPREFHTFGISQSSRPIHADAAIGFHPGQAGGFVSDGFVAVILELVNAIVCCAADVEHIEGFFATSALHGIALDSAVGEVHAEHGFVVAHSGADIFGGGGKLGVNDPVAVFLFPVRKFKDAVVDKGF